MSKAAFNIRLYRHAVSPFWFADLRQFGFGRVSTGETDKRKAGTAAAAKLVELQSTKPPAAAPGAAKPVLITMTALQAAWAKAQPKTRLGREECARAKRFAEWADQQPNAAGVEVMDVPFVSRWVSDLEAQGLAPSTIIRYRASVSALFRWAVQLGHAKQNPVKGSRCPKTGNRKKRAVVSNQQREETFEHVKGTPLEAVYMLAFFALLRREEIAVARWEHVDLTPRPPHAEHGTILAEGRKTEGSLATLPLNPRLAGWLRANQQSSGPTVRTPVGGHYHPQALQTLRSRMMQRKGIFLPQFHHARHTGATILSASGVPLEDVAELLRHESPRMVLGNYGWASPIRLGAAMAKLSASDDPLAALNLVSKNA